MIHNVLGIFKIITMDLTQLKIILHNRVFMFDIVENLFLEGVSFAVDFVLEYVGYITFFIECLFFVFNDFQYVSLKRIRQLGETIQVKIIPILHPLYLLYLFSSFSSNLSSSFYDNPAILKALKKPKIQKNTTLHFMFLLQLESFASLLSIMLLIIAY